jgi:hypothetical protein
MTKSVLFGTQSGTVSGSESDIKNYFNQVERYRTNRAAAKIHEYLRITSQMLDNRTGASYDGPDVEIEWGPLFKLDRDSRIQMFQNMTQGLSTMIGTFAMTPDEARGVLSAEFAEIDLDDLTEDQLDVLDRINLTRSGQGPSALQSEAEMEGEASPAANAAEGGRTGGRQQGQTSEQENPTADGDDSVADTLERLQALHEAGALSEDEFTAAKASALGERSS